MKFERERLIQVRESLGINKAEAARRLNMSAMGYGRYENGEREPSFQTVSFIAATLGTSTDYLYGQTADPTNQSITISANENPELYHLIEIMQKDNKLMQRILAYFS